MKVIFKGDILLRYCLSRFVQTFVVLIGVSIILFLTLYKLPGDPARLLAGMKAKPEAISNIRYKLGIDKPLYVQYLRYSGNIIKGDLGTSYRYNRPVTEMFVEAFPATAQLAFIAVIIEMFIGIFAGIIAAVKRKSFLDVFLTVSSTFLICIPVFWVGMVLQQTFGLNLGWFPVSGYQLGDISYLFLPAITLASVSTAVIIRLVRGSMLEQSGAPYLILARAKGLSEGKVIFKHQFKNAIVPVMTFIGMDFGALMTGAVATEIVFNYPGIGFVIYRAVLERDLPVVVSGVLIMVIIYVIFNFAVDILYGFLNPKIRLSGNA